MYDSEDERNAAAAHATRAHFLCLWHALQRTADGMTQTCTLYLGARNAFTWRWRKQMAVGQAHHCVRTRYASGMLPGAGPPASQASRRRCASASAAGAACPSTRSSASMASSSMRPPATSGPRPPGWAPRSIKRINYSPPDPCVRPPATSEPRPAGGASRRSTVVTGAIGFHLRALAIPPSGQCHLEEHQELWVS